MRARPARWLPMAALLAAGAASADDISDFYRDKTLSIVVGYAPGGGYDLAARVLAKHWGAHVPGHPGVVVRNMPGAGSVIAANYLHAGAPRDGTAVGSLNDSILTAPLMKLQGAQFDPRGFGWLGTLAARGTPVIFARTDGPATTFAQARQREVLLGAAGLDVTSSYPAMLNDLLGAKFKVVMGYKGGSNEINLAVERGEIHGRAGWEWESLKQYKPEWVANNFVTVIAQLGLTPNPELPDAANVIDLATSSEQRQIMELVLGSGEFLRSFEAPPGVPPARLAALRASFARTISDPAFAADMAAASPLPVHYQPPRAVEDFLARAYAMPANVVERAAKYTGQ